MMILLFIDPVSSLEGTTNITILSDSSTQISFSVSQITSNRLTGLNYTFTLNQESVVLESRDNETNSLSPIVTFSDKFTPDICYTLTVSVKNCANDGATASPTSFRLQGIKLYESYILKLDFFCSASQRSGLFI